MEEWAVDVILGMIHRVATGTCMQTTPMTSDTSTVPLIGNARTAEVYAGAMQQAQNKMLTIAGCDPGPSTPRDQPSMFTHPDGYLEARQAHFERFFGPITQKIMHSTDVKPVPSPGKA